MGARRSLITALGVPLLTVMLVVALILSTRNYSYAPPQTFTYQVTIQRGTNTTLMTANRTILLTIAYSENYGNASGTLMNDIFIASGGRVYVSFMPTFCEVKVPPAPLKLPPSPPPPYWPPPPAQKSVGYIDLYINFVPLTPVSGPSSVKVQVFPCMPFVSNSTTLLPGFYSVTAEFVWLLPGGFYGLNGTLNISVIHINTITPIPEFP